MIAIMGKLGGLLFYYGLLVGLIGVPVALLGLLVRLIAGSWNVAHVGLGMMGGGFAAFVVGLWITARFAQRIVQQDLERFMRQQQQREQIIDVEQLPPPSA